MLLLLLLYLVKRISQWALWAPLLQGTTFVNLALLLLLFLVCKCFILEGLKFDVMQMSSPNMVFFQWNFSYRFAYWFTSPFLHFIPCYLLSCISSLLFALYGKARFSKFSCSHCQMIPVLLVQYQLYLIQICNVKELCL